MIIFRLYLEKIYNYIYKLFMEEVKPKFNFKQYRIDHKDQINERMKSYREKNRDIINEKAKAYHEKNKETINAKRREKYAKDKQ